MPIGGSAANLSGGLRIVSRHKLRFSPAGRRLAVKPLDPTHKPEQLSAPGQSFVGFRWRKKI